MPKKHNIFQGFALALLILILLGSCATASPSQSLETVFDQIHRLEGFSGGILVAKKGEVLFQKAYGSWGIDREYPITTESIFRIASITKPFTATAIMMLQEEGKLAIDQKIDQYFPDLPEAENMSIRQLLTHTSGLARDYLREEDFIAENSPTGEMLGYLSPDQILDRILTLPREFSPGEKHLYSNCGYQLLAMIVEQVSGMSFEDYLAKTIFEPLEMNHTGFDYLDDNFPQVITGRYQEGEEITENPWNYGYGAGGLSSTLPDLYRFLTAYHTGDLVSMSTVNQMTSALVDADLPYPGFQSYGLGWCAGPQEIAGETITLIGHNGFIPGYYSEVWYYSEMDLTLCLYSNDNTNQGLNGYRDTILYYLYQ
jgi:CubicO group peptidase (beta-lactamase class C family)